MFWKNFGIAILAILAGLLLKNASFNESKGQSYAGAPLMQLQVEEISETDECLKRFSNALKIKTVADERAEENHVSDEKPFELLIDQLRSDFPAVFGTLDVDIVNQFSLLMTWKGSFEALKPIVLISHLDVVPAPENDNTTWTHPPFSGAIEGGYVWGRGALDTKFSALSMIESVNQLIKKGWKPRRTVILALGHDEEVGGTKGAKSIAHILKERGVAPEVVLDEGGFIILDELKLGKRRIASGPFAVVSTAEKQSHQFRIQLRGAGGHGSVPDVGSGRLVSARMAQILSRLDNEQMQTVLEPPTTDLLQSVGDIVSFLPLRYLLKHADHALMKPILGQLIGSMGGKNLAALVRTTFAPVKVSAGGDGASNVLPLVGHIELNVRSLPQDTKENIRQYLHMIIKSQGDHATVEDVSKVVYPKSTVTPVASRAFQLVKETIQETLSHRHLDIQGLKPPSLGENGTIHPAVPVFPMLLTGMTDSRWYHDIAPNKILRFSPFSLSLTRGDLDRIHGRDERVGVNEYLDAVRFFSHFIQKSSQFEF